MSTFLPLEFDLTREDDDDDDCDAGIGEVIRPFKFKFGLAFKLRDSFKFGRPFTFKLMYDFALSSVLFTDAAVDVELYGAFDG